MKRSIVCISMVLCLGGIVLAGPQLDVRENTQPAEQVYIPAVINELPQADAYVVPRMADDPAVDPNSMGPGGSFSQLDAEETAGTATPGVYSPIGGQSSARYSPVSFGGGGGTSPASGGYPMFYSTGTDSDYDWEWDYPVADEGNDVPEPATLALLGSGMIGIVLSRKRRK